MKKIFLISILCCFLPTQLISANDGAGFSVSRFVHQNQVNRELGYDYLKLSPGETTQLTIQINNNDDEPGDFQIDVANMHTNTNVQFAYGKIEENQRILVPREHRLASIVSTSQDKVNVPGKSSRSVTFKVEMPQQSFTGEIAGAITVTRSVGDSEKVEKGFTNQFAYALPIILVNEITKIEPKLSLGNMTYDASDTGVKLQAPLRHTTPIRILNLSGEVVVYDEKQQEVYRYDLENRQVAPQSEFVFAVPLNEVTLKPGDYVAQVKLADDKDHEWQWQKAFSVTEEQAQTAKNVSKSHKGWSINLWLVAIIALLAIVIVLLFIILRLLKQKK